MSETTGFRLERRALANGPRRVRVRAVEDVTPTYRRIALEGDLAGFDSLGSDDHLRIFFVPDEVELPRGDAGPEAFQALRAHPSREYTPVEWSDTELVLDFVLHGDGETAGPATTWARRAVPGLGAAIGGPRGSMVFDGVPDSWLLAGDRTALPAIRRFARLAAPGAPVDVVLIAEDPADEQELVSPGDLRVAWVRDLAGLLEGVAAARRVPGDGFAFLAAEQSIVRPGRELLLDRGADLERSVVKGYWKRGEAEYHAPH